MNMFYMCYAYYVLSICYYVMNGYYVISIWSMYVNEGISHLSGE